MKTVTQTQLGKVTKATQFAFVSSFVAAVQQPQLPRPLFAAHDGFDAHFSTQGFDSLFVLGANS